MSLIGRLQRIGLLPSFFRSELSAADDEDVLRSAIKHEEASRRATLTALRNHQVNGALRDAVRRVRSTAFADFEASVKSHGGFRRDR
jgi:hypothetical protein